MLRYSLRTLFAALVLVPALLAVWCNRARRQQLAVRAIKTQGGVVMYDYQWSANRDYTCVKGYVPSNRRSTQGAWIRRVLYSRRDLRVLSVSG